MTCIVAIKNRDAGCVVMAADSQASNNGTVLLHEASKIVARDGFLFGADGALWLGDFYRYGDLPAWPLTPITLAEWCSERLAPAVRAAATERNQWREINGNKEFGGQTLVARGDELVLMDSGGSVLVPAQGWWAIGSGGSEARGAIFAARALSDSAFDSIAMHAVTAAITLDDGCSGPVNIAWTVEPEGHK